MAKRRSKFGSTRRLPSGRWQARYTAPGGQSVTAPHTFDAKVDAEGWLKAVRSDMHRGRWNPGSEDSTTFAVYSAAWLSNRLVAGQPLKPRTRAHYEDLQQRFILPVFGGVRVRDISPEMVRSWFGQLSPDTPTQRAQAYAHLESICATAVSDDLLPANPCRIRGAGQARRASTTTPLTVDQLTALIDGMPPRYQAMTALAGWCGLRFGELTELRRHDLDLGAGCLHVRRAVVLVDGEFIVGEPKSSAGRRTVAIPKQIIPLLQQHVERVPAGMESLLFPAARDPKKHMRTATLAKVFYRARRDIGREDLRWHDLRHVGATFAAVVGANQADLQARFGWSTSGA